MTLLSGFCLVGAVILLFGSNKIPELARSLGAARREFDSAKKGLVGAINSEINNVQGESKYSANAPQPMIPKNSGSLLILLPMMILYS